jgi:hypothetical protein
LLTTCASSCRRRVVLLTSHLLGDILTTATGSWS